MSSPRLTAAEATTLDELAQRGFTDGFRVVHNGLEVLRTGKLLRPEDLVIREVHRFEGVRGTFIDAFGVYGDPTKAAALEDVPIHHHGVAAGATPDGGR